MTEMEQLAEDARRLELYSLYLLGAARNFLEILKILNEPEKKKKVRR